MKCDICGEKTTWDESFGRDTFIVCPTCYYKIRGRMLKKNRDSVLSVILLIGHIKEEKETK